MRENQAALKIQSFFSSYRLKKQTIAQQAIASTPASKLLQAFDLRFRCMRAVAAAKFPINKPIEDPAQVERVLISIRELAKSKNLNNLKAVERLFRQNILLAERIQFPYYHRIWPRSYQSGIDNQRLLKNAYTQLRSIVKTFNLPLADYIKNTDHPSSDDVLSLVREVIKFASNMIIDALAEPEYLAKAVSSQDLFAAFEKILTVYMTPSCLSTSHENIKQMVQEISYSSQKQGPVDKIEELKTKLLAYITRVKGNAATDDKINYSSGFWFFRKSRAINREANYKLAKELLNQLELPTSRRPSLQKIFDWELGIEGKREDIINRTILPRLRRENRYSDYVDRGINSSELNRIIEDARIYCANSHNFSKERLQSLK